MLATVRQHSGLGHALNFTRTVPSLIWALFCIAAVGLGPLAGVLPLSLYSAVYLGQSEAFEHAPMGPQEALRAIGVSGMQRFRRAVRPATRPDVVAAMLFMFEYNIRAAGVLSAVGAGGMGYGIKFYFAIRDFPAGLACLLLVFTVVIVLDACGSRPDPRVTGARRCVRLTCRPNRNTAGAVPNDIRDAVVRSAVPLRTQRTRAAPPRSPRP